MKIMIKQQSTAAPTLNKPLIVFGEDWGVHPSSTQHIIKVLVQTRQVIWVNSIGLRKPKLTRHDVLRVFTKLKSFSLNHQKKSKIQVNNNKQFIIINPLVIPCANNWLTLTISKFILKWQLNLACKKLTIKDPIIWSSLPTSVDYLELFRDAPSVYYCGDDFNSLAGVDHQFVSKKEKELVAKSNYIFIASETMTKKFPHNKTVNIPHGVDFSLFSERISSTPRDLPKGKPIAGFYGSISEWLDQDLLVQAIKALTHWNFVFIGKINCEINKLQQFPNVFFLGTKDHNELPQYIKNWNVAMLPFLKNKQIQMCNPLKLREYIASGTPIVTTDFNAVNQYRNHLQIADQKTPLYKAILLANAEITNAVRFDKVDMMSDVIAMTKIKEIRQASVKTESWEKRAMDIQRYLTIC
jgi:glycosyltransferase involved in cell wall biosynthesis